MKATKLEFRLRVIIIVVVVWLGFAAPWIEYFGIGHPISLIEWLALGLSRLGLFSFTVATPVVILLGALIAAIGAAVRIWGTAYLGAFAVNHGEMQAGAVMAAGPYRYVRNPLYIGTWFMIAAMTFIMTPTGALFVIVALTIFELRLILGEEAFLTQQLGEPYIAYRNAVPRIFPRLRTTLPPSSTKPHWLPSVLAELNPIGIFITLAFFSWTYNHWLMIQAILVSLGLSIVVRALMPGMQHKHLQCRNSLRAPSAKPSQVRPMKSGGILEPVAERAVQANVIDPDQRKRQQRRTAQQQGRQRQRRRRKVGMNGVVNARAPARSIQIAQHAQVGRKPQRRKQPPARSGARIEDCRERHRSESLKPQNIPHRSHSHPGPNRWFWIHRQRFRSHTASDEIARRAD
jgi:protein-S-isoprenylcysteine O-methyltransferase Ste14